MSDRRKRCVFCGGSDHPAECGYTQAELDAVPDPWRWLSGLFRRFARR